MLNCQFFLLSRSCCCCCCSLALPCWLFSHFSAPCLAPSFFSSRVCVWNFVAGSSVCHFTLFATNSKLHLQWGNKRAMSPPPHLLAAPVCLHKCSAMLAKLKACEGQGACSCINCAQLLGLFGLGFRFLLLLGLYFILFRCIFVACQPKVVCGGGREV